MDGQERSTHVGESAAVSSEPPRSPLKCLLHEHVAPSAPREAGRLGAWTRWSARDGLPGLLRPVQLCRFSLHLSKG